MKAQISAQLIPKMTIQEDGLGCVAVPADTCDLCKAAHCSLLLSTFSASATVHRPTTGQPASWPSAAARRAALYIPRGSWRRPAARSGSSQRSGWASKTLQCTRRPDGSTLQMQMRFGASCKPAVPTGDERVSPTHLFKVGIAEVVLLLGHVNAAVRAHGWASGRGGRQWGGTARGEGEASVQAGHATQLSHRSTPSLPTSHARGTVANASGLTLECLVIKRLLPRLDLDLGRDRRSRRCRAAHATPCLGCRPGTQQQVRRGVSVAAGH